jgi:hypothetical protein
MWNFVKRKFATQENDDCSRFRDSLEEVACGGASREMLEHSASCEDCAAAAEELLESRELLRALPRESGVRMPWFAPRVMAAIAAREAELRQSLDAWSVVPKLALRLTWISAVALMLASAWFLQRPTTVPSRPATDITGEPVQNAAPLTNDDVLLSLAEKAS